MACSKKDAIFFLLFLALYAVFCHVEGLDQCDSDSDCSNLQYCCEGISPEENVCGSVCIGESCIFHSHCAPGESWCASDNKYVPQIVLETRVPIVSTVVLENVVILTTNVQKLVLENLVHFIVTVLLVNLAVSLITNAT
jgi:hypothetical protein